MKFCILNQPPYLHRKDWFFVSEKVKWNVVGPTSMKSECTAGWWYLLRVDLTHFMLCQIVIGPQFQNFIMKCLLFGLAQGLKWERKKLYFNIFKGCTWMCSLVSVKAKWRETQKIKFSFFSRKFLDVKEVICKFSKKYSFFPVVFWKWNFDARAPRMRAAKFDEFWNGAHKNIPDRQQCAHFRK